MAELPSRHLVERLRFLDTPPAFATPQATLWLVECEGELAVLRRDDLRRRDLPWA